MPTTQLRHIARRLVRSPLFTVVALLTLALAIGANAAVFSVVNGILIKPLPFEEPERLVGIWHTAPGLGFDLVNQSPALHFTYAEEGQVFEEVGMWTGSTSTVTGLDEPQQVPSMLVTDGTLHLLGVEPRLGRLFNREDVDPDAPRTVVLTYGYWQQHFGADPEALGQSMRIDGRSHEIVGVLPAGMQFLDLEPELYLPLRFNRADLFVGNFSYQGLARLKPGVTIDQAAADVDRMIPIATEKFPQGVSLQMLREAGFAANIRPLKQDAVGEIGNTLWILLGTVGLVLLIACANVANLFLVRSEARQLEVALRSALGASRGQVARGFLLETVSLGLLGGAIGLGLAWGGLEVLLALAPQGLPRLDEISIDPTVLAFTLAISLLSGLLFGVFPALRIGRDFIGALKEGGRGGGAGGQRNRTRKALVIAQVAMALVLAVGSGLMLRSFQAMRNVNPGFVDAGQVLTARVSIPSAEIEEPAEVALAWELIEQKLRDLGGTVSVAMTNALTMDNFGSNDVMEVQDFPTPEGQLPPVRRFKFVTPTYFATMGNPLIAGRGITWADIHDRTPIIVVTENLAREYWGEPAVALGKRMRMPAIEGLTQGPWREIVGVVGNVRDDGIDQEPPTIIYWPMAVAGFWNEDLFVQRSMAFTLRTTRIADPSLRDEIRDAVWSVNRNLPLANVRTLEEVRARSMARTSFTLVMLAIAAATALLLGAVGIYGVSSYVVSQRTREIGIRMALGAQNRDLRWMVLRDGLLLAGLGVLLGLGAAVGLTRLMSALLFEVSAADPLTYAAVALVLSSVAMLATWLPARRATRVDPIEALRWK